ncbi:MAG: toxin-antitoxin system HicB family antitoxin [Vitreoscilla sp.]|nr:toxin-antitoxin system HicB family antitoxin [Polaromonas sp.]
MNIDEIKRGIECVSKRDGTGINQFVAMTAAEKLAALDAEDYFRSRIARVDLADFDRIMSRPGGEPPREGDER